MRESAENLWRNLFMRPTSLHFERNDWKVKRLKQNWKAVRLKSESLNKSKAADQLIFQAHTHS